MTTALIYARISVSDKTAPKVDRQIADCRTLATKLGYQVVEPPFEDDGISASTGKTRPGFEDLLQAVEAGKADVVLATEEERFARGVGDKERLSIACLASSTTWHTVRDGQVNPAEASGEFMSTIRAAMGKMESRRKAERQVAANAHRRANGERYRMGGRIFGWQDDKVTINEPEAALIREGIKLALAGASKYKITELFRASGIKPPRSENWRSVAVMGMLTRWSNAAVISYGEDALEDGASGKWEAIVSRKDIEAARTILSRTGQRQNRAQNLASGIARCGGCDQTLVASGGTKQKFYMCSAQRSGTKDHTVKHSTINVSVLDKLIIRSIESVYLESPDKDDDSSATELAALYSTQAKIDADMVDAYQDKQSGQLPRSVWVKVNADLMEKAATVQEAINRLATRSAHDAMLVQSRRKLVAEVGPDIRWTAGSGPLLRRGAHQVIEDISSAFQSLDLEEQRALVRDRLDIKVMPGRSANRVHIAKRGTVAVISN